MRNLMGLIGAFAVLTWLAIPAVRIWHDPELRRHHHEFQAHGEGQKLRIEDNSLKPAQRRLIEFRSISLDHRSSYWERYRSMLIGIGWPPGEGSLGCRAVLDRYEPKPEDPKGVYDSILEADHIAISL